MPMVSDNETTREFLNSQLKYVRENCPNLVTVAATLIPFRDVFYAGRIRLDPKTEEPFLWYAIRNHNLFPWLHMFAQVSDKDVIVNQFCEKTNELVIEHHSNLMSFVEFLRSLPRSVDAFMRENTDVREHQEFWED